MPEAGDVEGLSSSTAPLWRDAASHLEKMRSAADRHRGALATQDPDALYRARRDFQFWRLHLEMGVRKADPVLRDRVKPWLAPGRLVPGAR